MGGRSRSTTERRCTLRRIVAALSDTHAGSRYALCNPATLLRDDDRGEYHPTLTLGQQWLWDCYERDVLSVMELANGSPVDVLPLGDIVQGLRFIDGLAQSRFADQLAIAAANSEPWWVHDNVQSVTIVSGTGVHEGGEGSAAELVATLWQAQIVDHALLNVDGLTLDVAHHGPSTGIRQWTSGNVARFYLRDRIMRDDPPARVYLRAHRHDYIRETVYVPATADIVVTPAYQLPTAYVRQTTQSPSAAICGMLALEIVDGRLVEVWPMIHKVDLRKRVML